MVKVTFIFPTMTWATMVMEMGVLKSRGLIKI